MKEISKATVRVADDEWHIEIRFKNGEKYAPIKVDIEHEELADRICRMLNNE